MTTTRNPLVAGEASRGQNLNRLAGVGSRPSIPQQQPAMRIFRTIPVDVSGLDPDEARRAIVHAVNDAGDAEGRLEIRVDRQTSGYVVHGARWELITQLHLVGPPAATQLIQQAVEEELERHARALAAQAAQARIDETGVRQRADWHNRYGGRAA